MTAPSTPEPLSEQRLVGDERSQLEAFVEDNRSELVALLDGLTEEQARRRLVPSKTTLLGLVKHGVYVEAAWAQCAFQGATRAELGLPESPDASFDLADDDTVASVRAAYLRAVEQARAVHAAHALDDVALHNRRGPLTLRWVYGHLVEELARHCGHGDVLRELVLAR